MFFQQSYVKVTAQHLDGLYRKMEHATAVLDLEMPELFVMNDPHPNAMAIGVDKPFIVLTTGMLDVLDEAQITGVIGHELGHIHAGHQLYRTAIYLIVNLADLLLGSIIPMRDAALQAIYYALMYWNRCSELTADRAQMLIQRDFDSFVKCEMRFAAGCNYTKEDLNTKAFLQQADESLAMQDENILNRFFASVQAQIQPTPYLSGGWVI